MRKFMALHRNVRVRIGLAFVHKLIEAIRCTDRLAYDGTQRSQECLPVFWVRQRSMSFPMFAQS